ncbi:MAG: hypothetical protein QME32_08500, partial [Endomicrobiia bacterium]|nr:hypothetical protein [Endomicrobiia bacterium]
FEAAWRETENELLKTREKLQSEISIKETELNERQSAAARKIAAVEKEIEDKKLKLALAVSEFESERIRNSREHKNAIRKLESEAASILEKYTIYNEGAARALASAEDKIVVLTKRLVTREERIRNEIDRRREDAERYIAELRSEIESAASAAASSVSADAGRIENLRKELSSLEEKHMNMVSDAASEHSASRIEEIAESLRDVRALEKTFEAERTKLAEILEAKMSKIDDLEHSLDAASRDILAESARRRAFMDNLMKQGARLSSKLKVMTDASPTTSTAGESAADNDKDNNNK